MSVLAETSLMAGAQARVNYTPDGHIYLRPRPLALAPGSFILLPLLPASPPIKTLPAEIWASIFILLLEDDVVGYGYAHTLMHVSKGFKDIVLPLLYSHVRINTVASLRAFTAHLYASDQKWDSIRRIPYSTPGRWVKAFDLSLLHQPSSVGWSDQSINYDLYGTDELLSRVFPLLPFLEQLHLSPSAKALSRRALSALTHRDGAHRLRVITGLKAPATMVQSFPGHCPVVNLLRCSAYIEELEVIGTDNDDIEGSSSRILGSSSTFPKLEKLRSLSLLSMHNSNLLDTLAQMPLPALSNLIITPDGGGPYSLVSSFLKVHGSSLLRLTIHSLSSSWPPISFMAPAPLLLWAPRLTYLSLSTPLPEFLIPSQSHPLQMLSLPRPDSRLLAAVEVSRAALPDLRVVSIRDIRWLRAGVGGVARNTGAQGEMYYWKSRLSRRGVALLDADWSIGA